MKWQMGLPSRVEKRVVSSGISPLPWVARTDGQRLVLGCWQQMQLCFMHCGMQQGITISPTATRVTPAPTLSTIPVASWPRMTGKIPSGSYPSRVQISVWQRALEMTLILISPALGGSTQICYTLKGALGSQAIAALHVILCGSVILIKISFYNQLVVEGIQGDISESHHTQYDMNINCS